jgi:cytochrome b561
MMTKQTPDRVGSSIAAGFTVERLREETTAADIAKRGGVGRQRPRDHHRITKIIHWATIPLVLVALGTVLSRDWVGSSALRKELSSIHQTLGIAMLVVFSLRFLWRGLARPGALHRDLPLATRIGAAIAHYGIYLGFFALCILGWLTSDALGRRPSFFGHAWLPALIGTDRDLGDTLQEWHLDMAWIIGCLVAAHVSAALWHHFVRRDHVLASMLPSSRRRVGDAVPRQRLRPKRGDADHRRDAEPSRVVEHPPA